ncbi:Superoxide dismutase [Balamuthia mandrillaris]
MWSGFSVAAPTVVRSAGRLSGSTWATSALRSRATLAPMAGIHGGRPPLAFGSALGQRHARSLHTLPYVGYAEQGLLPCFSLKGLRQHYHELQFRHTQKLNSLVAGTQYEALNLEDLIHASHKKIGQANIHNIACELWNHNFFWKCMTPEGTSEEDAGTAFLERADLHFGGIQRLKDKFSQHAMAHFGSGWTWLVDRDGHLEILNTSNAGTILTHSDCLPLLALDVWEHAYHHDFGNRKEDYIKEWWRVVDWAFVGTQLEQADKRLSWKQRSFSQDSS